MKRTKALVATTVLCITGLVLLGTLNAAPQGSPDTAKQQHKQGRPKFLRLEVQKGAKPKLVEVEAAAYASGPEEAMLASFSTQNAIELTADCETDPTPTSGIRRDCDSDPQVVTCQDGFYFVEGDAVASWEIDRGTDNRYFIEWSNRVELYPGTRVFVPRTVKFWVHARGPSGPNSGTGRSKVKLTAQVLPLPPHP